MAANLFEQDVDHIDVPVNFETHLVERIEPLRLLRCMHPHTLVHHLSCESHGHALEDGICDLDVGRRTVEWLDIRAHVLGRDDAGRAPLDHGDGCEIGWQHVVCNVVSCVCGSNDDPLLAGQPFQFI